ncbi:hypothetical protein ACVDFE_35120 [Lentzea chajnantorensis]
MIGSDPDRLDRLASTLLACADRVDGVRSELAVVLLGSPWRGHDAAGAWYPSDSGDDPGRSTPVSPGEACARVGELFPDVVGAR